MCFETNEKLHCMYPYPIVIDINVDQNKKNNLKINCFIWIVYSGRLLGAYFL